MKTKATQAEFDERMAGVVPLNMSLRSTVAVEGATAEAAAKVSALVAGIISPDEIVAVLRAEHAKVVAEDDACQTLASQRYRCALKNHIEAWDGTLFRRDYIADRQAREAAELEAAEALAAIEDPVLIRLAALEAALDRVGIAR